MAVIQKTRPPPSRLYGFVRARQLEGTYPGDRGTGVWPITACRIGWGWGSPPEKAWPYDWRIWPSKEPAGIEFLAHENLGVRYQRVRSLFECKLVLAYISPLNVSVDITKSWFNAPQGRIPDRSPGEPSIAAHSVTLIGYNDSTQQIQFVNSWGPDWGDKGAGYLSYHEFERSWCEGWCLYPDGPRQPRTQFESGQRERLWSAKEFGGGIFHAREIIGPNEDRIAWAFAIQRGDFLDVEELFVRPQYRGQGFGRNMVRLLVRLAFQLQMYPRIWISYPDTTPENLLVIEKLFNPLGLCLREAPVRWAPFVVCAIREKLYQATLQLSEQRTRVRRPRLKSATSSVD
jgi:GNAT superfamily N-acetyltransferase